MADSNTAPSLKKFQGKYLAEVNEYENRFKELEDAQRKTTYEGEPLISFDEWKRRHPEEWKACQDRSSVFAIPFRHHKREPGEDDIHAGATASPRLPGFGVEDLVDGHLPSEKWGE